MRNRVINNIKSISVVEKDTHHYHLKEDIWKEVIIDWPFYSKEEHHVISQRKAKEDQITEDLSLKLGEIETQKKVEELKECLIHMLAVQPYKIQDILSLMKVEDDNKKKSNI